jgi:hypothetical protein
MCRAWGRVIGVGLRFMESFSAPKQAEHTTSDLIAEVAVCPPAFLHREQRGISSCLRVRKCQCIFATGLTDRRVSVLDKKGRLVSGVQARHGR